MMTSPLQWSLTLFLDLPPTRCPSGITSCQTSVFLPAFCFCIKIVVPRFKSPSLIASQHLKSTVLDFQTHQVMISESYCPLITINPFPQDYEVAYNQLLACNWLNNLVKVKSKQQQAALKEHIFRYLRRFHKDAGFNIESCHRLGRSKSKKSSG